MKTIYTIPAPDSLGAMIEVYGEPENAWYEWRIIDGGRTVRSTGPWRSATVSPQRKSRAGLAAWPFTVTRPFAISSVARLRVL